MLRKTGFSVATAAGLFLALAGLDQSGANAQNAEHQALTLPSDAELTDEVMPVFVSQEVVQDIPETPEEQPLDVREAASLRELVAEMPASGELSEEMRCLAGAVFFESRGEPLEGQLAVAQVIVNRTESGQFPSSYCGVVHQRSQFSFVRGGTMPRISTGSAAWKRATAIARIAHQGLWDSKAGDSLYFHARYVKPSWANRKVARATIDSHVFYR